MASEARRGCGTTQPLSPIYYHKSETAGESIFSRMSLSNCAYLAGLIDGDGSITIVKRDRTKQGRSLTFQPKVSIGGYPPHLEALRFILPLGNIWIRKRLSQRHLAEWTIAGGQCRIFLAFTMPFLRLKYEQAKIACSMPFCRSRWDATPELRNEQVKCWLEIKRLNSLTGRGDKKWQVK